MKPEIIRQLQPDIIEIDEMVFYRQNEVIFNLFKNLSNFNPTEFEDFYNIWEQLSIKQKNKIINNYKAHISIFFLLFF
jgi:hypothetical protein